MLYSESELLQGARARWGTAIVCEPAAATQRYCGPVFATDEYLVQRASRARAVVHRRATLQFTTSARLRKSDRRQCLEGLTLSIYYIGGRGVAYLRGAAPAACGDVKSRQPVRRSVTARRVRLWQGSPIAAAVTATLALGACAGHKLVTPNGKERVAVNTADSLKGYQDLVVRQDAMALEKSRMVRRVEELNHEVATLKSYVLDHNAPSALRTVTTGLHGHSQISIAHPLQGRDPYRQAGFPPALPW